MSDRREFKEYVVYLDEGVTVTASNDEDAMRIAKEKFSKLFNDRDYMPEMYTDEELSLKKITIKDIYEILSKNPEWINKAFAVDASGKKISFIDSLPLLPHAPKGTYTFYMEGETE